MVPERTWKRRFIVVGLLSFLFCSPGCGGETFSPATAGVRPVRGPNRPKLAKPIKPMRRAAR